MDARAFETGNLLATGGRSLLALLFILAGAAKIAAPRPFLDHMREFKIPTHLLPGVAALELGGGLALLLGWRVREAAVLLGLFCAMTALVLHRDITDKVERSIFFKDLAIAGGLFVLAAYSAS